MSWIKLHRKIYAHWIFKDAERLRAWIIILGHVNFKEEKVALGNDLLICKRGESLMSLDSWAKLFGKNWNKSKVRRFLNLLQNDSMIVLTNEKITTRLTVCNYDTYQDERNTSETQVKRKRNASETQVTPTKEGKEEEELKEGKENSAPFNFFNLLLTELNCDKQLLKDWIQVRAKKKAANTQTSADLFIKQVKKSKLTADQILTECIERSWAGFKDEWLTNSSHGKDQPQQQTRSSIPVC